MARSKASYKAAAKKAVATRKRNQRKGISPSKRGAVTPKSRKRRAPTKKGMLSELFNPKMAQAGGKAVLSGAVGGIGAGFVEKLMGDAEPNKKLMVTGVGAFAIATVLKMPNVGAGMMGVAIYKAMESTGMLAEEYDLQDYGYANPIESLPMVLNEDGDGMFLQEDDGMFLQEDDGYGVGYYQDGQGFGM